MEQTTWLEAYVHRVLAADAPRMDPGTRERLALEAHHRAGLPTHFPSAEALACGLQLALERAPSDPALQDGRDANSGLEPRLASREEETLVRFGQIAGSLLLDVEGTYSQGDRWLLALALALPCDRLELVAAYRQRVPAWAVSLRFHSWGEMLASAS